MIQGFLKTDKGGSVGERNQTHRSRDPRAVAEQRSTHSVCKEQKTLLKRKTTEKVQTYLSVLPDLSILSVLRGSSWEQKVSGAAELEIILLLLLLVVIHEAPVAAKRDARSSGCRWSSRVSFESKVSYTHSLSVVFTLFIIILSELSSSSPAALCSSTDPLAAILLYARLALFTALSPFPSHVGQECQKCDKIGRVAKTFCGGLVVMLSVVAACHFGGR